MFIFSVVSQHLQVEEFKGDDKMDWDLKKRDINDNYAACTDANINLFVVVGKALLEKLH